MEQKNYLITYCTERLQHWLQHDYAVIKKYWENIYLLRNWLAICQKRNALFSNQHYFNYQQVKQQYKFFSQVKKSYYQQFIAHRTAFEDEFIISLFSFIIKNYPIHTTPTSKSILALLEQEKNRLRIEIKKIFKQFFSKVDFITAISVFLTQCWVQSQYYRLAKNTINYTEKIGHQAFFNHISGFNSRINREHLKIGSFIASLFFVGIDFWQLRYQHISLKIVTVLANSVAENINIMYHLCDEINNARYTSTVRIFLEITVFILINILLQGYNINFLLQSIIGFLFVKICFSIYQLLKGYICPDQIKLYFLDYIFMTVLEKFANYCWQIFIIYFDYYSIVEPTMLHQSPYEILQVDKYATKIEIQQKWREFAKKFHPDKNSGTDLVIFYKVRQAYELLLREVNEIDYLNDNDLINIPLLTK